MRMRRYARRSIPRPTSSSSPLVIFFTRWSTCLWVLTMENSHSVLNEDSKTMNV